MPPLRGAYGSLTDYLSTQPILRQFWLDLSLSFSERVKGQISRYQNMPNSNLPPVFKLTREQREKYLQIYSRLSEPYKKLADIALGVPIPTDEDSEKLLDAINWIDDNARYEGKEKTKRGFKWDFRMTGPPINLAGFVVECLKDKTFSLEALARENQYMRELLEENPK